MPFKPLYLVRQWGRRKSPGKAARYSDSSYSKEIVFKVRFDSGFFPGQGLDIYFESQAEASHFSLWTIVDPAKILRGTDPDRAFVVGDVFSSMYEDLPNAFTDLPSMLPVWNVPMADPQAPNYLNLRYRNERQARSFKKGFPYRLKDILGTTKALPADISAALEAKALAIQNADKIIGITAQTTGLTLSQQQFSHAEALLAAGGPGSIYFVGTPSALATAGTTYNLFVVDGGAAGWYISGPILADIPIDNSVSYEAAGMVYHSAGTWAKPYNGLFVGAFANALSGNFLTVGIGNI